MHNIIVFTFPAEPRVPPFHTRTSRLRLRRARAPNCVSQSQHDSATRYASQTNTMHLKGKRNNLYC